MAAKNLTDAAVEPIVIRAGEGNRVDAGPFEMAVIEDGSHTSGRHAVLEFTLAGQFSPPPHIHHQHEEVIYVIEGEMALPLRDETIRIGPGSAFVTPIGLPHTFSNGGTGRLRFLLTISPASHIRYFLDMAEAMQQARGALDPETMMAIMKEYGLEPIQPA